MGQIIKNLCKKLVLAASITAISLTRLAADVPDLSKPKYAVLLSDFQEKSQEIQAEHIKNSSEIVSRYLAEAVIKEKRSRISGNASVKADSSQLVKILTAAQTAVKSGQLVSFPEKLRPGNELAISQCRRELNRVNNKKSDANVILLMRSKDTLRKLIEDDGIKLSDGTSIDTVWTSLFDGTADTRSELDSSTSAPIAATVQDDGGDVTVYATKGAATKWLHLARIDITVHDLQIIAIPLFPVEIGKTVVRGTDEATGQSWQASVSAPRTVTAPTGKTSFRLKRVDNNNKLDVVTWPSSANGWTFELRARPGKSGSCVCLVEYGE